MLGEATNGIPEPSADALRRLIAASERLESEWQADLRPDFARFLEPVPRDEREHVLRELLGIDLELRRRAGHTPHENDYGALSETHRDAVREALSEVHEYLPKLPVVPGHELLERLGIGGMGMVYRARQIAAERIVAVKLIRGDLADWLPPAERAELMRRFEAEARAVAALDHPGIVPIHEVGEAGGWRYFTMRFVEGGTLQKKAGTLGARETATLIAEVARALQHAHDRGVLHRDLKPANILLDGSGRPMVADFGLAKRAGGDTGFSQSMPGVGTPGFMPPEQALGAQLTPRSDIFALGATLFATLTGHPPAMNGTPREHAVALATIPAGLRAICLQCLRSDPAERYPSALALADDLERFVAGRPVVAWPEGWRGAARRILRKPRVRAAACVFTLALAASAGWWWFHLRPQQLAVSARAGVEHANSLLNSWSVSQGLFALEAAIRSIPPGLPELKEAAEANLAAWAAELPTTVFVASVAREESAANENQPQYFRAAAVTRDGARIAIGAAYSGDLAIFDSATHAETRLPTAHQGSILALAWSADGNVLATSGRDEFVRIWRRESAGFRCSCEIPIDSWAYSLALVSDGKTLAMAGTRGDHLGLSFWDVRATSPKKLPGGDSNPVARLSASPSGENMLVLRRNGVGELWNSRMRERIFTLAAPVGDSCCFIDAGERIATGGDRIRIFSAATGKMLVEGNASAATIAGPLNEDGLVWVSQSGETLWARAAAVKPERILMPRTNELRPIAASGETLWAIDNFAIVAMRWKSRRVRLSLPEQVLGVAGVGDFFGAARCIPKNSADFGVYVWPLRQPSQPPTRIDTPRKCPIFGRPASDGQRIYLALMSKPQYSIRSFDAAAFTERHSIMLSEPPYALLPLPDELLAAAVGDNGTLRFWRRGELLPVRLDLTFVPTRLAASPDGRHLTACDRSGKVACVELSPSLGMKWVRQGPKSITGLYFFDGGASVVVLSDAASAEVFRVADGGKSDSPSAVLFEKHSKKGPGNFLAVLNRCGREALLVARESAQRFAWAAGMPIGPAFRREPTDAAEYVGADCLVLIGPEGAFQLTPAPPLPSPPFRRRRLRALTGSDGAVPLSAPGWAKELLESVP